MGSTPTPATCSSPCAPTADAIERRRRCAPVTPSKVRSRRNPGAVAAQSATVNCREVAWRYFLSMRLAISIPQLDTGTFDTAGVKSYLARAEQLGFEAGWVMEQSIGPTPLIAPLEMLAYAAACTERLRLGVAVVG
jgi:hypothetical protein